MVHLSYLAYMFQEDHQNMWKLFRLESFVLDFVICQKSKVTEEEKGELLDLECELSVLVLLGA